jgi:HD-GYP domain-containing protein (c-di-GMP phosphodiesterase class II)
MESPPKITTLPRPVRIAMAGVMLAVTLGIALAASLESSFFRSMDLFFYDRYMKLGASNTTSPKDSSQITIVDIDETSLSAVGQWPWPRYRLARMVRLIHQATPRAMGMDILFAEPDRSSLGHIIQRFETDFNLRLNLQDLPRGLDDNDLFFGTVLAGTSMVGARYFYFDHTSKNQVCRQSPFDITDPGSLLSLHQATGVLCNTPAIETRLNATGFINNQYDSDGILRRTPLLIQHRQRIFPHLSLALFMESQGIYTARVEKTLSGPCIVAGPHKIPITRNGFAAIRFTRPGFSFQYLSAVDVLNRQFKQSDIQDRIILMGSSAVGLNDIHHTIFDPHFPGVEVSAVIMDNLLNQGLMILPAWTGKLNVLVCLVTGLFMGSLFYRSAGPGLLFSASLAWAAGLVGASLAAHWYWSVCISPAAPVFTVLILFFLVSLSRFAMEKRAAFDWYQRLSSAQQLTMEAMVSMVETRDPETGEHIVRTQHYARAIAEHLRDMGFFKDILTEDFIKNLFLSVPLHDIGKVGTPDRILLKPGKLTDKEFVIMKMHAQHGRNIITRAAKNHQDNNYLALGSQIAGTHHEKWNGQGYPLGLSGTQIPLAGRIMAISDVYDALISKRCYKPPFSHEKAMAIILEEKGKLFDPMIVEAFVQIEDQILQIANEFHDTTENQ